MQFPTLTLPAPTWRADGHYLAAVPYAAEIMTTARDLVERAALDLDVDQVGADLDVMTTALAIADRIVDRVARGHRARHTWWHGDRTRGDTDQVAPAPDPYTRVRATTRQERSNRGVTIARVTVHGRAMVGGDTVRRDPTWHGPTLPGRCTMTADRLAHAIDTAPRTALGHVDGIALARLTAVAFPDVPDLVGGDVLTWHTAPNGDPDRGDDSTRARRAGRTWPTRYRLATVRPRKGETSTASALLAPADHGAPIRRYALAVTIRDDRDRVIEYRPARVIVHRAPSSHAWRGHDLVARPDTVRDRRTRTRRAADDAVTVPESADLGETLAAVARMVPRVPYRVTWSHRGMSGAVTVSGSADRRRYAVSGLPRDVRGYLTAEGMGAAVDRVTA